MRGFESASFHRSQRDWFGEGRSVGAFSVPCFLFVCLLVSVGFFLKPCYFFVVFPKIVSES